MMHMEPYGPVHDLWCRCKVCKPAMVGQAGNAKMLTYGALAALVVVAAVALMGCSPSTTTLDNAAELSVSQQFPFPSSVDFHRVHEVNGHVCGEVRGRKADGNMTDWRRFTWTPNLSSVVEGMSPLAPREQDELISLEC